MAAATGKGHPYLANVTIKLELQLSNTLQDRKVHTSLHRFQKSYAVIGKLNVGLACNPFDSFQLSATTTNDPRHKKNILHLNDLAY